MNEEKKYKIYALIFPGGEIYFGQTSNSLEKRFSGGYTGRVKQAIEYYGKENVKMILLMDGLSKEQADFYEQTFIYYNGGVENPKLLNEQSGGTSGYYLSEKLIEQQKQRYIKNPELKEKVSQHSYRAVNQYTLEGEFVNSYSSITEAGAITGISMKAIQACASPNTDKLTAGGFVWAYTYEVGTHKRIPIINIKTPKNVGVARAVLQISMTTGRVIARYNSIAEARRASGARHICECANGKVPQSGGYIWKYAD